MPLFGRHPAYQGQRNSPLLDLRNRSSETPKVMLYSVDPHFSALVFSVYSNDAKIGLPLIPDSFGFGSAPSQPELLTYAQNLGLQILSIGEHYMKICSQVRVGSVIFLVGVGSLVCWRLWNYWNESRNGRGISGPHDSPPPKVAAENSRNIFSAFLEEEFVQDIREFEDGDPALIQGRYFGPESPMDHGTPPGAYSSLCSNSSKYQADKSASADDDMATFNSDGEQDSLPYDSPLQYNNSRRLKRRLRPNNQRRSGSSSPSGTPQRLPKVFRGLCSEDIPEKAINESGSLTAHPYELHASYGKERNDVPNGHPVRPTSLRLVQRRRGDGSETAGSDLADNLKRKGVTQFANYNSEEDWDCDSSSRLQPEGEEQYYDLRRNSRQASFNNLMERFRQRNQKMKSLSRDNSVTSNLSDFLTSGGTRFLHRDDSVASNFSDFTPSECSEFSLDFSMHDEALASQTLSCLVDIEQELDTLKSSVVEMDEEFFRYASRPNPYLLKTTFSDYSLDGSRPGSSLQEAPSLDRLDYVRRDSEIDRKIIAYMQQRESSQGSGENSMDWESPQHGWYSINKSPMFPRKIARRSSSLGGLARSASQDPPSLEWDNCGLRKYEEDEAKLSQKRDLTRHLFLPDHANLELDLEEELKSSEDHSTLSKLELCSSPLQSNFVLPPKRPQLNQTPVSKAPIMTMSIDSAICSAPGSRSGSMSPVSQALSQSMMSSGLGASFIEDSEVPLLREIPEKTDRKNWSINESGYIEEQDTSISNEDITDCGTDDDISTSTNSVIEVPMGNKLCSRKTSSEDNDPEESSLIIAIGKKVKIETYATTQWKGDTTKARTIREGYGDIKKSLKATHIRTVRGDNYCGIRATIFNLLAEGIPLPEAANVREILRDSSESLSWLSSYNFGNRLAIPVDRDIRSEFSSILFKLQDLNKELQGLSRMKKEAFLEVKMNADPTLDVHLCEAVKLHMLAKAITVHKQFVKEDKDLPVWATMLFLRDSSCDPREFMLRHLNAVGDTAGLEQVEMCLLGSALEVTIKVVRPSCFGNSDFICHFPDDHINAWPKVHLIAEDDRHYNILSM